MENLETKISWAEKLNVFSNEHPVWFHIAMYSSIAASTVVGWYVLQGIQYLDRILKSN